MRTFDFSHEAKAKAFWKRVGIGKQDECWPWKLKPNHKGYGRFGWNKSILLAHRVAYELTFGLIPDGLSVCHSCDNPACCNPAHLWLGTIADNNRDMFAKGRGNILTHAVNAGCFGKGRRDITGENHPMVKLTWEKVREMRRLRQDGWTCPDIAKRYGIAPAYAHQIVTGKTWREDA